MTVHGLFLGEDFVESGAMARSGVDDDGPLGKGKGGVHARGLPEPGADGDVFRQQQR